MIWALDALRPRRQRWKSLDVLNPGIGADHVGLASEDVDLDWLRHVRRCVTLSTRFTELDGQFDMVRWRHGKRVAIEQNHRETYSVEYQPAQYCCNKLYKDHCRAGTVSLKSCQKPEPE